MDDPIERTGERGEGAHASVVGEGETAAVSVPSFEGDWLNGEMEARGEASDGGRDERRGGGGG